MPLNQIKVYNDLLELVFMGEKERIVSLRKIFDRDIANNHSFKFRDKCVRPIKKDGMPALESLFQHLTHASVIKSENGRSFKSRSEFDVKRSERLHWVWHHIQEKEDVKTFSTKDRKGGKDVIRTYIWDKEENYTIVLEPYRNRKDYYLLSAYYLQKKKGGIKAMQKRYKRRLNEVY